MRKLIFTLGFIVGSILNVNSQTEDKYLINDINRNLYGSEVFIQSDGYLIVGIADLLSVDNDKGILLTKLIKVNNGLSISYSKTFLPDINGYIEVMNIEDAKEYMDKIYIVGRIIIPDPNNNCGVSFLMIINTVDFSSTFCYFPNEITLTTVDVFSAEKIVVAGNYGDDGVVINLNSNFQLLKSFIVPNGDFSSIGINDIAFCKQNNLMFFTGYASLLSEKNAIIGYFDENITTIDIKRLLFNNTNIITNGLKLYIDPEIDQVDLKIVLLSEHTSTNNSVGLTFITFNNFQFGFNHRQICSNTSITPTDFYINNDTVFVVGLERDQQGINTHSMELITNNSISAAFTFGEYFGPINSDSKLFDIKYDNSLKREASAGQVYNFIDPVNNVYFNNSSLLFSRNNFYQVPDCFNINEELLNFLYEGQTPSLFYEDFTTSIYIEDVVINEISPLIYKVCTYFSDGEAGPARQKKEISPIAYFDNTLTGIQGEFKIFNILGEIVFTGFSDGKVLIPNNTFPSGLYTIKTDSRSYKIIIN